MKKLLNQILKLLEEVDPCYKLKSIKNSTEIKNTINAHIEDGLAH